MKCKNCGAELMDGIMFCPECGVKNETNEQQEQGAVQESANSAVEAPDAAADPVQPKKYCPQCGLENEADAVFCGNCGFSFTEGTVAAPAKDKKPGLKKVLTIGAVAVGVVVLGFGAYTVIGSMGILGKKDANEKLVYIKDNEINMMAGKKPVTVEGDFWEDSSDAGITTSYAPLQLSDDGKYLFYPQDYTGYTYDLYRRKANARKGEGVKIDSGIRKYELLSNNRIAYVKDDGGKLYISNMKDKEKVDANVSWFRVSDDKKYILWCTGDNDLYVRDTGLKKDQIKLASGIEYSCYTSEDLKTLIYKKEGNLYIIEDFGDDEKIASDVDSVSIYHENDKLIVNYVKVEESDSEYSMGDFVNDDMADADAKLEEPQIEDYQKTVTTQGWGGLRETTETDYDAYYDAYEEYEEEYYEKQDRDSLRECFDEPLYVQSKEVYYYDVRTKKSNLVVSLETDRHSKTAGGVAAIEYYDIDDVAKVKLSEVTGYSDLSSKISTSLGNSMKTCVIKGTTSTDLDIDAGEYGTLYSVYYANDMFYLTYGEDAGNILLSTNLSKDKGKVKEVSDEVSAVEFAGENGIYYITSVGSDGEGELYLNDDFIADEVKTDTVTGYGKNALLYGTDVSNGEKTLMLYKSGKSQTISDDVADYYVFDDDQIALLVDYNFKRSKGDLKLYNNGKLKDIDTDVAAILRY